MSYALYVRCGGVNILSFHRESKMFEYLGRCSQDVQWTTADFSNALYCVEEEIETLNKSIARTQEELKYYTKSTDIREAVNLLQFCRDEIEELTKIRTQLNMLDDIQEAFEKNKKTELLLEYRIM